MYKCITPAWKVAVVVLVGSRDARLAQTGELALRINKSVDGTCHMFPRRVSTRPYLQTILLLSQALQTVGYVRCSDTTRRRNGKARQTAQRLQITLVSSRQRPKSMGAAKPSASKREISETRDTERERERKR